MGRTKAAGGGREGELGRGNDSGLSQQSGESVVKPVLNSRTNANRDWVSGLWSRRRHHTSEERFSTASILLQL